MNMLLTLLSVVVFIVQCETNNSGRFTDALNNQQVEVKKSSSDADLFLLNNNDSIPKIIKTEEDWKKQLTSQEYYVLRKKGTERAFTGSLLKIKDRGIYTCKGCGLPLFSSAHKFDSGTGWPSFYDVINAQNIHQDTDYDIGYPRTELTCASCGGHLGHVFDDGPKPTGLRYCINSVSLDFVKEEK